MREVFFRHARVFKCLNGLRSVVKGQTGGQDRSSSSCFFDSRIPVTPPLSCSEDAYEEKSTVILSQNRKGFSFPPPPGNFSSAFRPGRSRRARAGHSFRSGHWSQEDLITLSFNYRGGATGLRGKMAKKMEFRHSRVIGRGDASNCNSLFPVLWTLFPARSCRVAAFFLAAVVASVYSKSAFFDLCIPRNLPPGKYRKKDFPCTGPVLLARNNLAGNGGQRGRRFFSRRRI